jgi:hypothetical protein
MGRKMKYPFSGGFVLPFARCQQIADDRCRPGAADAVSAV